MKLNSKFCVVVVFLGALMVCGCSGPQGGSSETDKRYIDGKPVDPNGGDVAPGQARRAAARKGP